MAKLSPDDRILFEKQERLFLIALNPFANINPEITAGLNDDRTIYVTDGVTTIPTELIPKHFLNAAKYIRKNLYKTKQTIDFLLQKNICSLHDVLKPFAKFNLNTFYKQIQNKNTNILMLSYEGKPVNSFLTINNFLHAEELYEQVSPHIINNK